MKSLITSLFILFTLTGLRAQTVPSLVNYQGRLLDAGGNPRSGNVSIVLSVYTAAAGGSPVYTETLNPVAVNNGLFSLQFGGQSGFAAALANPEAWLDVRVDGAQVGPRSRLVAVPYALKAATVETVIAVNNVHPTPAAGSIRWTGSAFEGFNGTSWIALGQPAPLVNIEMVTVGNPGNADDPSSNGLGGNSGAVPYTYKIGKYEVTNAEYGTFLNAVDPNGLNTLALYSAFMGSDSGRGGITFTAGNADGAKYVVKAGFANKPVVYVGFHDAMRFCNWLHNGAQAGGDTESGAYTLLGNSATPSNGTTVTRNAGAKFTVPSENEWYKAAYHQPQEQGGDTDNYWLYPIRSNGAPSASAPPGTAPAANFSPGGPSTVTPVGAYTTTVGFYGTFDMAGNVFEWEDTINGGSSRVVRGGSWLHLGLSLRSDDAGSGSLVLEDYSVGFRVSSP